jgi:hypothetical protein
MKKLLIVTGPQGSGNHLFSRVFSTHPKVGGWKQLLDEYWVPSDLEPFAEYWVYPKRMTAETFEGYDYWLANVSVPFVYDGVRQTPKILEMASQARSLGIEVTIAIIVRDQNIQTEQQLRVRKEVTLPIAQEYYYNHLLTSDFPVHFLDNEAFFLHKQHYLKWVSNLLQFPVDYDNSNILKFITEDPNRKYVKHVDQYWLDEQVWLGIQPKSVRGLDK